MKLAIIEIHENYLEVFAKLVVIPQSYVANSLQPCV